MFLDVLANYFPFAVGALVVAVLLFVLVAASNKAVAAFPYEKRGPLLTPAENRFYQHQIQALPPGYRLFSKVRIADVLKVQKGLNNSNWQTAFNKISAKHFDFVLCDAATSEVRAVIELDDKSHNSSKAKTRDAFVDAACSAAAIPMIRIKASNSYDIGTLRERMQGALSMPPTS